MFIKKKVKMNGCSFSNFYGKAWIVYKKTDEWYIEWQRVTTSGTSDNEWQRVTTSGTTSHNEWQRVTTSDNGWQRVTTSDK